jgi:hypothetical protein
VEVQAGNRHASKHSSPGLWASLERLGREHWPVFIRGDKDWGTEGNMARAEQEGLGYLFKLVTSLDDEILTLAQHYRDRADCENSFDELKNHWGWGGFTTQDLKRCRFMARMTALVYNWWSLFVRLADPSKHTESLTSRPLFLHAPARLTRHSGQTRVSISHSHAEAQWVETACRTITSFFKTLTATAEQLTPVQRWCRVLSQALVKYLHGRQLEPPALLPAPG